MGVIPELQAGIGRVGSNFYLDMGNLGVRALRVLAVLALIASIVARADVHAAPETCATAVPGGEWRSYGRDYGNSRNQPESTIDAVGAASLAPSWTFSAAKAGASGSITGTPLVADGCVYVATDKGGIFALNAATGAIVWKNLDLAPWGSINSTLAVHDGKVFANVSPQGGRPQTVALDQATGQRILWSVPLDDQSGSDVYSSPVVYDDNPVDAKPAMVFVGVSGGGAGNSSNFSNYQGSYRILDSNSGATLARTYVIHDPAEWDGRGGAGIWSTPAIDIDSDYAYVGTGNPLGIQPQPATANAILKIDLNRDRSTFGKIVDFYQGDEDTYVRDHAPSICSLPELGPTACSYRDLDMGASPNLFRDSTGRKLIGAGQKSGVYHAADAETMDPAFKKVLGVPSQVGGIVGTATVDSLGIHGPHTLGGYLWSIEKNDGKNRWITPTADGGHWGIPASSSNGVIYTIDFKGFLDAYDALTGVPILHRPMLLGSGINEPTINAGGGVAIARNTVYAVSAGYVVSFKPAVPR